MEKKFLKLRVRRDIGDIISAYFEFLKQNFKTYFNIFISYNGIFILALLGCSYLLVSGFMGFLNDNETLQNQLFIGFGFLGFIIVYIITAILNYSLAASYMVRYIEEKGGPIEKRSVWSKVSQNLGKIILFILLLIVLYLGVGIVGAILSFIPVLGMIAYYFLVLGYTAWMGLSFMVLMDQNRDVTDSLGEGWNLLTKFFWKAVLSNLIVTFLLGILMMMIMIVPGILIGFYVFHSLDSGQGIEESAISIILWTLALTLFLVMYLFNQSLVQFVNGVIYYSLHEEAYNVAAQERIDEIGRSE